MASIAGTSTITEERAVHRVLMFWQGQGLAGQQQPSMPMVHLWVLLHDKLTLGISGTGSSHADTVHLFIR
jgi:hypothetical protein